MKPDAVNQAFGLRNLPMDAFRTGEVHLGEAVARIVRGVVTTSSPDKTLHGSLLESLTDLETDTVEAWWRQAADKALRQTLDTSTTTVAEVFWIGLVHSEATRNYILEIIPDVAGWENSLSQTVPVPLIPETADAMATFCIDRGWWDLFAAVVGAAYEPSEALRRQVKAEERIGLRESPRVERLATKVDDLNLVELAVEVSNCQQLLKLAGTRCSREPKLLSQIDMRKKAWRNVWSISLAQTGSLTMGLSRPKELINAFLSEVAGGRADDKVPLELIAASPFANVLQLAERAALWDQLPAKLKPRFITVTLDALVEEIIAGSWAGTIEPALLKAARENEFNQRFLSLRRSDLAAVLAVEDVLHNLSDAYLKDYIKNLPEVNGVVAVQLGKLVALKQWSLSAYAILERAKAGVPFRPALTECINLFKKWERLWHSGLFGYRVSKDDAWDLLRSTMIDLYEEGPEQEKIWKRAGGDPARLTNAHTRREQWASAIELIRRGGGGKITADSLIDIAIVDYENNSQLQTLHTLRYLFKE